MANFAGNAKAQVTSQHTIWSMDQHHNEFEILGNKEEQHRGCGLSTNTPDRQTRDDVRRQHHATAATMQPYNRPMNRH